MQVEKKSFKFIGSEAKAEVIDMRTQQRHTIYMYGNWSDFSMKLYLGKKKEGGRLLAEAGRNFGAHEFLSGQQEYVLRIEPGSDAALCVLMCITYDEFNNEQ